VTIGASLLNLMAHLSILCSSPPTSGSLAFNDIFFRNLFAYRAPSGTEAPSTLPVLAAGAPHPPGELVRGPRGLPGRRLAVRVCAAAM